MKDLEGKILLVLGKSYAEVDVVKIAQSWGCYVIVTDQYTDPNVIPACFVANEAWNISWTDYDALETRCRQVGVQGVLAGFSEFRVEAMIELCRRLSLPCYINSEQLDITRDKNKFKHLCKKYGIPCVKEYAPDSADIAFPVIVKPIDRGGSIGITVAYTPEEYQKALELAYSLSPSKSVIVEDYIGDGVKFDCSYYLSGKKVTLIETCDTTMLTKQKGFETMQKAWTFPSKQESKYIEQVDPFVKAMLSDLNMKCGVANISFFFRNDHFYVFETGFRLGGGHSYDYQRATNGIDYLSCMIKFALGVPVDVNNEVPLNRGYAITYNVFFRPSLGSVVKRIYGEKEVKSTEGLVTFIPNLYPGYEVKLYKPVRIAMLTICSDNLDSILENIRVINRSLKVEMSDGFYSVFCELTSEEILTAIR